MGGSPSRQPRASITRILRPRHFSSLVASVAVSLIAGSLPTAAIPAFALPTPTIATAALLLTNAASVLGANAPCTSSTISAGWDYSLAADANGNAWSWGDNARATLGDGTTTSRSSPVQAAISNVASVSASGWAFSLALKTDGTVWGWGYNSDSAIGNTTAALYQTTPIQVMGPNGQGWLTNVVQISAGGSHALALKADGTVWAWGYNPYGLGDGTVYSSATPVQVVGPGGSGFLTGVVAVSAGGNDFSLALKADGSVWGWGLNRYGQLDSYTNLGSNTAGVLTPVQAMNLGGVVGISAGGNHGLALESDGSVWAWGTNVWGELGNSTNLGNYTWNVPPYGVAGIPAAAGVSAGNGTSVALVADGTVWAWGNGQQGQMGNGTATPNNTTPVQSSISGVSTLQAGGEHIAAVKGDGTAWAWGYGAYGQLGNGTQVTVQSTPVQTTGIAVAQPAPCNSPGSGELLGPSPIDEHTTTASEGNYPVNSATGNFWHTFTDITIPGRGLPLTFVRTYNSLCAVSGSHCYYSGGNMSPGWTHNYNVFLTFTRDQNNNVIAVALQEENGSTINFTATGAGGFTAPPRVLAQFVGNADGTYILNRLNQTHLTFNSDGRLVKETDRNGYATVLNYTNNLLATVVDPENRSLIFSYDPTGTLKSVADNTATPNRSVSYQYDSNSNLSVANDLAGSPTSFSYWPGTSLIQTMTDARGGLLSNWFDGAGRTTQQQDPMSRITTYTYNPGLTTITDPKGNVIREQYQGSELWSRTLGVGTPQQASWFYYYDSATLGLKTVRDPANNLWQNTWYPNGTLHTQSNPLNQTWTYTYDSLNDVLTAQDPLLVTTTNGWDTSGNIKSTSTPLVGSSPLQSSVTTFSYDPAHPGDVLTVIDAVLKTWTYGYDPNGIRNSVIDPMGDKTTATYDSVGRLVASVSAKRFTTTYGPDVFGRPRNVIDPLNHQTLLHYDANGNMDSLSDANSHLTLYNYDADNELYDVQRADTTHLKTAYDKDGNVWTQTDGANQTTTYLYDPLNRLLSVSDPLNRTTTYSYDNVNEQVAKTDPQGRTTTSRFDVANRLASMVYNDPKTPNVSYQYDADGQRLSMTDGTGTSTYLIDSLHRVTKVTTGANQIVQFGYDLKGQLTLITYPGGTQKVIRTPDAAGRLYTVKDWNNHTTTYGYDPDSNVSSIAYPNGTSATLTYDNADHLTSIVDAKGTSKFLNLSYSPDPIGQALNENAMAYNYDPINQLHSAGSTTFGYDPANNLHTITAANTTTLTNDNANQLSKLVTMNGSTVVQQYTYSYDAQGNRTSRTDKTNVKTTFGFDQANRMTSSGAGVTYAYNGDGLRMSKLVSATTTQQTWDVVEGLPLLLKDGTTSYVTGLGGLPIEQITSSGTTSYYHQDRIGSTRAITNSSGTVVATKTYDPYGNVTATTGTLVNPFQFAGQYTDSESGLQYLRARFYDPVSGSFLSRDPMAASTRSPYGYASNSPVNASDPSGLFDVLGGMNAAVGGFFNMFATPAYAPDESNLEQLTARGQTQGIGAALPVMDALNDAAMIFGLIDGSGEVLIAVRYGLLKTADRLAPEIARIVPGSLPRAEESSVLDTLAHIDAGTEPGGAIAKKWGTQFKNSEGELPGARGAASPYREYRVAPSPGTNGAGLQRIVVNSSTGDVYYSWTHYGDAGAPAFVQIR